MKVLINNTTQERIFANGLDFTQNNIRLNDGSQRIAPAAWDDYAAAIVIINDAETTRLAATEEFATDWTLTTE